MWKFRGKTKRPMDVRNIVVHLNTFANCNNIKIKRIVMSKFLFSELSIYLSTKLFIIRNRRNAFAAGFNYSSIQSPTISSLFCLHEILKFLNSYTFTVMNGTNVLKTKNCSQFTMQMVFKCNYFTSYSYSQVVGEQFTNTNLIWK